MRVSVVICTLNRADSLRATMQSLQHQRWPDLEVVVVNGPSTDHTEHVIAEFSQLVKARTCPEANLSMSRNIGIRAASGDIVAFIDDDALPEFEWLRQAIPAFDEDDVAGVGGIVFDHTGMSLQYRYSCANRFAEASSSETTPFDSFCVPGAFTFPYLQGTNALFRRDVLLSVGGFDETYEYYLDETDLCCRLVDAGHRLRQLPNAPVHHKFLPSGIRDHQRVVTNWFPIVKNHVYFAYRHASGSFPELEIIDRCRAFVETRIADAWFHEQAGRLPSGTTERARTICGSAMAEGMQLGRARQDLQLTPLVPCDEQFAPFPTNRAEDPRRFVFFSADFPPRLTGGIARFMGALAPALTALGHEVRVVTCGDDHGTVDLEDGVWIHRLAVASAGAEGVAPGALPHINDFATAAADELERIGGWAPVDAVYGPVWDVEVLGALTRAPVPVIVHLATPVAVTSSYTADSVDPAIMRLMGLESEVYRSADLFHANSSAVLATISEHYGHLIERRRARVIPLGLMDRCATTAPLVQQGPFEVLFVGRLEPRKGIEELFEAIEAIAPRREDVHFLIAGVDTPAVDGRDMVGARWRARHIDEEWMGRVHFLGNVDDDRLHELYDRTDLVVLPSRYESFGLVMVEALMHGKPLITCRTGGIVEFVRHDDNGWLVPPGDAPRLRQAIDTLIDDGALRARLATSARRSFEERLSIEVCAQSFSTETSALSLVHPGSAAFSLAAGAELTSTTGGHRGVIVHSEETVHISAGTDDLLHVPVYARRPSRVSMDGSGTAVELEVEPCRWVRLDATAFLPQCVLTVLEGEVVVGAAIRLRGSRP